MAGELKILRQRVDVRTYVALVHRLRKCTDIVPSTCQDQAPDAFGEVIAASGALAPLARRLASESSEQVLGTGTELAQASPMGANLPENKASIYTKDLAGHGCPVIGR
jgi:hypothetical protein